MAELVVHHESMPDFTRHNSKHATAVQKFQDRQIPSVSISVPRVTARRLQKKTRGHHRHAEPRAIDCRLFSPEDLIVVDAEPLCPRESNDTDDRSLVSCSSVNLSLTTLMRQIHDRCYNKYARVRCFLAVLQFIDT